MKEIRLANIAGLDIGNAQHSVAINEALIGIDDSEAFLDFCRDHKDGITYATKPERLDALATRYKKMQDQAALPHKTANNFSAIISKKIETVRIHIKNRHEAGGQRPISGIMVNKEKYFTDQEVAALEKIGSVSYIIELSETNELTDALVTLFLSHYTKKSKYAALTDGQKRIKNLIGAGHGS